MTMSLVGRRVWVAGHRGMVGSALARRLAQEHCTLLTVDRTDVDLRDKLALTRWLADARPEVAVVAAGRVGGILANDSFPADFLYDNVAIAASVVDSAWRAGVAKLLYLGSSCIYPRLAAQPITENSLLTGTLEPTNEWYAVAKIVGVKLCQAYRRQHGCDFVAAVPTNVYGPNDNFHVRDSHVLPALMRRIHDAKESGAPSIALWGSGRPRREFMHVDDLADACVFLLQRYADEAVINIGSGSDLTITELAEAIAGVVGWTGTFTYDTSRPDGMPMKMLDGTRLRDLGWTAQVALVDGIRKTYDWFLANDGVRRTE